MTFSTYIAELLKKYDYVIIPGFGGLITNDRHSYVNYQRSVIFPPGKNIAFNQNLSTNDGLLADYIAAKQQITYSSALLLIQKFVEDLNKKLQDGNSEEFDSIGSFHLSDDQKIQFKPETTDNLSPESYGLSPVHAVVVKREETLVAPESKTPKAKSQELRATRRMKSKELRTKNKELKTKDQPTTKLITYMASAAACLAIAFFIYSYFNTPKNEYIPNSIQTDSTADLFSLSDIIGYHSSFPAPIVPKETIAIKEDVDTVFIGSVNKKPSTIPAKNNKLESKKNVYNYSGKKYQIVGGVFKSETNAMNYIGELKNKGVNASLIRINSGKRFRVILGDHHTLADAERQLQEIKKINQDAWILTL